MNYRPVEGRGRAHPVIGTLGLADDLHHKENPPRELRSLPKVTRR